MSNELKHFVGIDISKQTIDVALIKNRDKLNILSKHFENVSKGFIEMEAWLCSELGVLNLETLFCMEHTGIYNHLLCEYLIERNVKVCIESPLEILRSMGMHRGKNDKIDAIRIAAYACKNADELAIWNKSDESILDLKQLLSERERLLKSKTLLEVPVKELQDVGIKSKAKLLHRIQSKVIRELESAIAMVDNEIHELIKSNQEIKKNFNLLTSIPGIGKINAWTWICMSQNFTRFSNAKQLACFCGVAPFEYSSGSSIRGKTRVSSMANKNLKKLLHMAALSAIQCDQELKVYYQRKVLLGKNKMSVINAVRNKLAHRIFAVIRDQREFEIRIAA